MSVTAFLRDLAERDIRIARKGDRLQISAAEGALTDQLRAEIAARKSEILAFLEEAESGQETEFVLRHAPRDQRIPLSFSQQRLWFLYKLHPEDTAYNLGASAPGYGEVNEPLLNRSLQELARRHEILRTVFREENGIPFQVVTDTLPVMQTIDLTHVPAEGLADEVRRVRDVEIKRPFDLAETPAFRTLLIRETKDTWSVLTVVHHILADGWSLGLMVKQIGEIYAKLEAGHESELASIPWQYADYAYTQRTRFDEMDQRPHTEYWTKKLSGSLPSLNLPIDRPRSRVLGSRGGVHTFTFPEALTKQLRALSSQSGMTLFTTLLAVYKVLIARYAGQTDVVLGTPVANRNAVELESLIGLFVSTLVLRTDLSNDPTFHEVLKRLHEGMLEAHQHQDYPFEKLVELARPDRNLAHSPLFQVAFILNNTPNSSSYDAFSAGATFELSLYVLDTGETLSGSLEYNTDLFDAGTIARMADHLVTLAETVVADPDTPISRLPILTSAERTQLLETWNNTATAYPNDTAVHAVFEQQVDATPDAIAIVAPSEAADTPPRRLTYRELDQLANRLAHQLRDLGVMPNSTVGIALSRSVDFVVAVLATLKNGAAYVPVDPALPAERLAGMLDDADVPLLLTTTEFRAQLPHLNTRVVCLDHDIDGAAVVGARLQTGATADSLAYVMFTSGSTGRPKGVNIPHRAIVRLVRNTNYASLSERDVILSCAPVSFDASTFELWGSLLNGGTLVIYPKSIPEPEELAQMIRQYGVTTLWLTAGLFHLMAENKPEAFTGLRQLLAGGDVLSPAYVRKALRALDGGVLINGYGPTENTTFTCCYPMTDESQVGDSVPIGRPISNTRVYVLDANMQPVPVGVHGELWAGGDGVAQGYRKDAELTADRFRPDPFSSDPNARLYRTGDVVRYRPDGVLEFLGRVDKQVKIRGFRVEPGEIEQALSEHSGIRDAVVVVRQQDSGNKQLVAYVVLSDAQEPVSSSNLRQFLQERLPEYAVPSAYVVLDTFPLTPNGKVDYDALPTPAEDLRESNDQRTAFETQLLVIWEHVLGLSGIGTRDNFFDLGGNSLLGVQLLAQLEKVLGKRLPVSVLFQGQTVESMALVLREDFADVSFRAVAIKPGGNLPPLFIVPGVSGDVIGYQVLAQALGSDQPVYGLRSAGLDGETKPISQIEAIAASFLPEIFRVQAHGPYHLVGMCMGGIVAYEIAQQLIAAGKDVGLLGLIDTWPPTEISGKVSASRFAQLLAFIREGVSRHWRAMRERPRGQRLRYVREKLGIVSEMVAQRDIYRGDVLTFQHDLVARANQYAAARYAPRPYPGQVLTVVTKGHDLAPSQDPRLTWKRLARKQGPTVQVEGEDSGKLLRPPYVSGLAEVIKTQLEVAASGISSS